MLVWSGAVLAAIAIVLTAGMPGVILLAILVGFAMSGRPRIQLEVRRVSAVALVVLG